MEGRLHGFGCLEGRLRYFSNLSGRLQCYRWCDGVAVVVTVSYSISVIQWFDLNSRLQ